MHTIQLSTEHTSDHDLERYCLGMVTDESELTELQEHLLWCPHCVERAEETRDYVDAMRVACIRVDGGVGAMAEGTKAELWLAQIAGDFVFSC